MLSTQVLARHISSQDSHSLVGGMESGAASLEASLEVSYKHPLTMGSNHLAPKCFHLTNHKLQFTLMYTSVSSRSDGLVKDEQHHTPMLYQMEECKEGRMIQA